MSNTSTLSPNVTTSTPEPLTTIPPYVCCVVTEGVWTWFGAFLLIFTLFTAATFRYCKKTLGKPKFWAEGHETHLKQVLADDKGALNLIRHHATSVDEFSSYYARRRKHDAIDTIEFQKAVESARKFATAKIQDKKAPFEYNRVLIKDGQEEISANKITNYRGEKVWIISEGPQDNQGVVNFWQMVWQENSETIVMLTRTFEVIRVMCVQYWPLHLNKVETFGEFEVVTQDEEAYAHFTLRRIHLKKGKEERLLNHYHYNEWPQSTPPPPNSVLHMRKRFLSIDSCSRSHRPVVVHCHDGSNRSAMFVAIMDCLSMGENTRQIDVFATVKRLLEQRRQCITEPEQLKYIYDVIEDHLLCGDTSIPIDNLLPTLQSKSIVYLNDKLNAYQSEHKLLSSLIPRFTIGACAAGHRAENRAKNRNVMVVPPDKKRPYLTSFQSNNESSDYVNAVFVDGYKKVDEFIVTEWPTNNTLNEFWALIHDYDIKTVVVLSNHKTSTSSFPSFWPSQNEEKKNFGSVFCVESNDYCRYDGKYASWDLTLTKQQVKSNSSSNGPDLTNLSLLLQSFKSPPKYLKLFQIQCWPTNQRVPNSTLALVSLIDEVEKWRQSSSVQNESTLVVSDDGVSRCGVFCAAAACLEQVAQSRQVDVFQAVKTVRQHRPQLIGDMLEYKYCYDVVLHYILHYCRSEK